MKSVAVPTRPRPFADRLDHQLPEPLRLDLAGLGRRRFLSLSTTVEDREEHHHADEGDDRRCHGSVVHDDAPSSAGFGAA